MTDVPMPDLYEETWDPTGDTLYQWLDDISNRYPKATVSARRVQEAINRERQLDIPQLMDDLLTDILNH